MAQSKGGLDIRQDMRSWEREWKAEVVGRYLILLIAVGALAGLLGPGPLSSRTAGEEGSALWVEYNRFERYQNPIVLRIYARPEGRSAAVSIARGFLRHFEIEGIEPAPAEVRTGTENITYLFPTEPGVSFLSVAFRIKADEAGMASGEISLPGGPSVLLSQLIYP